MSEHGGSSSQPQQGQHQHDGTSTGQSQRPTTSPQPPPFNPLPSHHSQLGSSLGHSVVPDLMKIYESLTHSSTPQLPPPQHPAPHQTMSAPPNVAHTQYSNQPIAQQQHQHHQHSQCQQSTHYAQPVQAQQPQYQQHNQYGQPQQQAYHTQSQDAASAYGQQQGSEHCYERQVHDPSPPASEENVRVRRSRKRSLEGNGSDSGESQSKGRKKGSQSDGRWSKRFTWPEDLHRDFVSAVFDVGLKHSSPSALMEFMPKHDQITSERIKSHLQKYRLHRAKSKKEFMSSYDASLNKFQVSGIENNIKSLSSGEVAAHIAFSTMSESENPPPSQDASQVGANVASSQNQPAPGVLYLPQLTDAEKQSPIGASMGYLMGLFFSLRQQLMQARAESGGVVPQGHTTTTMPVVTDAGSVDAMVSAVQFSHLAGNIRVGNQQPHQQPHQQQVSRSDLTVTWSAPHAAGQPIDSQQSQHQQTYSTHPDASVEAKVHQGHQHLISPSTRSNVEETNMMKREMKNQMAIQNKMRALKQQELNKYKKIATGGQQVSHDSSKDVSAEEGKGVAKDGQMPVSKTEREDSKDASGEAGDNRSQYAGQTAGVSSSTSKNARGQSFGNPEDFWNSGDDDDHLFEFLMNT